MGYKVILELEVETKERAEQLRQRLNNVAEDIYQDFECEAEAEAVVKEV